MFKNKPRNFVEIVWVFLEFGDIICFEDEKSERHFMKIQAIFAPSDKPIL